jgi:hypothetical protein
MTTSETPVAVPQSQAVDRHTCAERAAVLLAQAESCESIGEASRLLAVAEGWRDLGVAIATHGLARPPAEDK